MGLEGLSIGALAELMHMSKSGVFAHFGSREELQISVIREYHERFAEEVFRPAIREPRGLPRLRALFERWIRRVSVEIDSGCIYISGAVEFDDRPGPVRDALAEMVRTWHGTLEKAIRTGDRRGPPARRHRPAPDAVRDPRPDPVAAPRRALPQAAGRARPRPPGLRAHAGAPPASAGQRRATERCAHRGASAPRKPTEPSHRAPTRPHAPLTASPFSIPRSHSHAALHPAAARHAVRAARAVQRGGPAEAAAAARRDRRRHAERRARGRRQVRRRGAGAAEPRRRRAGLRARPENPRGHRAGRLQGGVRQVRRRRLAGAVGRSGIRRPGPADPAEPVPVRDAQLGQPGLDDVPGPVARRLRMPARARHRRAEGAVPAQADEWTVDRHHVPDREPLRHRPRHAAHQGRAAARRQLQAHRPEDLHLGRRTRPGREHHPPGAGAPARRAARQQGHLAVRGAEVPAQRRRLARRAQPDLLHRPRAQDGHPRQRHRAAQPRRRHRLAGGRAQQGPAGDVRDDERGAPGRGQPVARPDRGGVPERRGLREGPHPDAFAVRPEGARQAGRSDHRAPRRAQDAAHRARLCRRRPRAEHAHRAADRHLPRDRRRRGAQERRGRGRAADADRQGLPHRQRLDRHLAAACRCSAATATSANGAWSSSCATRAST